MCGGTVHMAETQEGIHIHVHIAGVYRRCNVMSGLAACRKQMRYQQQTVYFISNKELNCISIPR